MQNYVEHHFDDVFAKICNLLIVIKYCRKVKFIIILKYLIYIIEIIIEINYIA